MSLKPLSVLLCCHFDIPLLFLWKLPSSRMTLYSPCCLLSYMFSFFPPIAVKACGVGRGGDPRCFQCSDWSAGHWPKVEISSMQRSVFNPFPDCLPPHRHLQQRQLLLSRTHYGLNSHLTGAVQRFGTVTALNAVYLLLNYCTHKRHGMHSRLCFKAHRGISISHQVHQPGPMQQSSALTLPTSLTLSGSSSKSLSLQKRAALVAVLQPRSFFCFGRRLKSQVARHKGGLAPLLVYVCVSVCVLHYVRLSVCRHAGCVSQAAAEEEESLPAGRDESMQRERGGGGGG